MPSAWKVPVVVTGLAGAPYLMTCWVNQELSVTANDANTQVTGFIARLAEVTDNNLTYALPTEIGLWSTPETLLSVAQSPGATVPGVASGNTEPRATQGLLRLRTDGFNGNRRVLGHIFVPGVTSNAVNPASGAPTLVYQQALTFAGEVAQAGEFCVASRKQNQFFPTTVVTGDTEFAVLRSRRD